MMPSSSSPLYWEGTLTYDIAKTVNAPRQDLIITGNVRCTKDLDLHVRNLVILGSLSVAGTLTIETEADLFLSGELVGRSPKRTFCKGVVHKALDEIARAKITQLGVRLVQGLCVWQRPFTSTP